MYRSLQTSNHRLWLAHRNLKACTYLLLHEQTDLFYLCSHHLCPLPQLTLSTMDHSTLSKSSSPLLLLLYHHYCSQCKDQDVSSRQLALLQLLPQVEEHLQELVPALQSLLLRRPPPLQMFPIPLKATLDTPQLAWLPLSLCHIHSLRPLFPFQVVCSA